MLQWRLTAALGRGTTSCACTPPRRACRPCAPPGCTSASGSCASGRSSSPGTGPSRWPTSAWGPSAP
ncbi:hypothetical protein FMM08_12575 [Quadrisphaera setariae]|uniref:Uncharacterized protein n=1 Tax=Quadrisphaera setariae TaxID=2593304 RepID=A0A5C8ZDJ7_9ACTN|nr:hypothetical protein FMM08_12575 [Quadrisphaera setariae]